MDLVGIVSKYFEFQCIPIRSKLENSSRWGPGEDQRGGGGLHGDGAGGAALPGAGADPGVHGHHHLGGLPEHADSPQSVARSKFSSRFVTSSPVLKIDLSCVPPLMSPL